MASTTIFLNDQYTADTSTNTVVGYVDATVEKAKTDILNDLLNEVDSIVEESISSKMSSYSLTSHQHESYATKDDLSHYSLSNHQHESYALVESVYNKLEVDLKVTSSIPDLSPYATKDELQNFSPVSHQHSDYALVESVYTKNETENLVNSHVPDLTDYFTKNETLDLISEFKPVQYLSTLQYEELESKDPSTLYVLTDSTEEEIDLSQYVTKDELELKNYKSILYITTQLYEELESKDPSTLYVLTDSTEDPVDLTDYYNKSETNTLISNFKPIQYLTTQLYEELESKDPSTLYVLIDSTEEQIDLTQYVTKEELELKNYKSILYITTQLYEELVSKDPSTLYVLTDSEEPTIDLSSYALNSSLSEHINDASAHFTTGEKEAYDNFSALFYVEENWNIMPMTAFNDFTGDYSTAMGQFDTRIANNNSSISAIKSRLNEFSLTSHTHDSYVLNSSLSDNYYDKTQTDEKLDEKANICVLDIYAIAEGNVTVTEEMWNEWIECLINHGIFYHDNGDLRLTLEVFGGVDANGEETDDISFIIVGEYGYSYILTISKEDDGEGNISFTVNSPVENYVVYDIENLNEWDDDKWNYVTNNLDLTIFSLGGIPLSIRYDEVNNKLIISTVEEGNVKVYTVTREEDTNNPGTYTYTVTEAEQYEIEDIDRLDSWDDDKWNLVSKNSNGARLFTYDGNPLNVTVDSKNNQIILSYIEDGTILRQITVTQVATRAAAGNTYTVESNNFDIANVSSYYLDLEKISNNEIIDDDWNNLCDAFVNNVPVLLKDGNLLSSIICIELDNNDISEATEIICHRADTYGIYSFKINKNGSNDYEFSLADEYDWEAYYTKSYIDTSLNNIYTKSEIDTTLAGYSLISHTHNDYALNSALNDYYNKTYIDTSLNNVYTKSYIDTSLNNIYTKSEIDTMIGSIETVLATI